MHVKEICVYTYNPNSIMNPQLQLNNYLAEQAAENARNGYSQALGKGSSPESKVCGAIAGYLLAKLVFDLFDR